MIITTEKKNVTIEIAMTQDEMETLKYARHILAEIGNALGAESNEWMATATGEIVGMDELPRVLGILSAFAEQDEWESEGD